MKISEDVFLVSAAAWFPEDREPTPATCDGPELPGTELPVLRVESLPVARSVAAPEMAVLAARECLARADWDASRLTALIHAHIYHQGHDSWPVAHYIANELAASPRTLPLAIQGQFCNGGMVALELAAAILQADEKADAVLLTTADNFGPPGWQRWENGRPGGFGDGGTAALLTRTAAGAGTLRLLSVASSSQLARERLFRGEKEFTPAPMWRKTAVGQQPDSGDGEPNLLQEAAAMRAGAKDSLVRALADAGVVADDPRIRYVALPRIDQLFMELIYSGVFSGMPQAKLVTFGADTGHIGAGDTFANMVDMRERNMLSRGDLVIFASSGIGDSWSTAVFEVVADQS